MSKPERDSLGDRMKLCNSKLLIDNFLRYGRSKSNRTMIIFKCATQDCTHELKMNPIPSHLKRYTGFCTKCLRRGRPFGVTYGRLLNNAKAAGVSMELNYEQFLRFTEINLCTYCGSKVVWTKFTTSESLKAAYNLDRIDSKLGYSVSNCVVCCETCNFMKRTLSKENFLLHVERIHNFNVKR